MSAACSLLPRRAKHTAANPPIMRANSTGPFQRFWRRKVSKKANSRNTSGVTLASRASGSDFITRPSSRSNGPACLSAGALSYIFTI